jgi:glycosyltransferase involved in cell wall biosynthesis
MTGYSTKKVIVSIIIPYYNNAKTLGATLNNLVACLGISDFEVILIEDQKSEAVPPAFLEFPYSFPLIYRKNGKAGASANRNLGLQMAKGQYIQFLDADDLVSEDKINNQLRKFENCENPADTVMISQWGIFYKDIKDFEFSDSVLYKSWDAEHYLAKLNGTFSVLMPIHSYLIPKALIDQAGLWNETINHGDDGEFMNRVIAYSKYIEFSESGYAMYRRGNSQSLSYRKDKAAVASTLLCVKSLEKIFDNIFHTSDLMRNAVIFKYQVFFISTYPKYKKLSEEAETRILALGGNLHPKIGRPLTLKLQKILGIKPYLAIKFRIDLVKSRINNC